MPIRLKAKTKGDAEPKPWLPDEKTRGRGPRKLAATLLVMAFVLLTLNGLAGEAARLTNTDHAVVAAKWRLLERGAPTPTTTGGEAAGSPGAWLVLGDSSGNQGVDTEALAERLGGPAVNLCTIGDMLTLDSAWMLDEWTARHGPPAGVVLVHVYDVWDREPQGAAFGLIPSSRLPDEPEPPLELTRGERLKMLGVQRAPLVMLHETHRRALRSAGSTLRKVRSYDPFVLVGSMNGTGFLSVLRPDPANVDLDVRVHTRDLAAAEEAGRDVTISAANAAGLRRLAAACRDAGAPLYVVHAPAARSLSGLATFQRRVAAVDAKLRELLAEAGWGELLFESPLAFDDGRMQNADHLTAETAAEFTAALADAILSSPVAPRSASGSTRGHGD